MAHGLEDFWSKLTLTEAERVEVSEEKEWFEDGISECNKALVQIHGLPLGQMFEKIGIVFGETMGELMEMDMSDNLLAWGKYIRVKVNVSVTKLLLRGSSLEVQWGDKVLVLFRYEHLPDCCYISGRLDHHETECNLAFQLKKKKRNEGVNENMVLGCTLNTTYEAQPLAQDRVTSKWRFVTIVQ
ncbi:hypothetical protein REPUB_Repub08aG0073400 [Reevesia pubescens]